MGARGQEQRKDPSLIRPDLQVEEDEQRQRDELSQQPRAREYSDEPRADNEGPFQGFATAEVHIEVEVRGSARTVGSLRLPSLLSRSTAKESRR